MGRFILFLFITADRTTSSIATHYSFYFIPESFGLSPKVYYRNTRPRDWAFGGINKMALAFKGLLMIVENKFLRFYSLKI
jgi:hypothetical protein